MVPVNAKQIASTTPLLPEPLGPTPQMTYIPAEDPAGGSPGTLRRGSPPLGSRAGVLAAGGIQMNQIFGLWKLVAAEHVAKPVN